MKEVNWGDVILSAIIVSILAASAAAASYMVFHMFLDQSSILGVDAIYVVVVATCLAGSLLVVKAYPGPKSDFGPGWAWVLLIVSVPALGAVSSLLGKASPETASEMASWWLSQLSALTFVVVLSIYMHTRDSLITMETAMARDF
jgi:hypothetical protein